MKTHSGSFTSVVVVKGCLWFLGVAVAGAQPRIQPFLAGRCDTGVRAKDVAVSGNYAYVADGQGGLQVIGVADPSNCMWVSGATNPPNGDAVGVAVAGNYAYLADGRAGMLVFDVSNPTNCPWVGGITQTADDVAVAGDYAYVAGIGVSMPGLRVINVSNPTNCVQVGGCDAGYPVNRVAVAGSYAYLTCGSDGLWVINVSDPTKCVVVGRCQNVDTAIGVAVAGNHAYVTSFEGLRVVDVSNPTNCVRVGGWDCPDTSGGSIMWDVALAGRYAYLAHWRVGVEVIDVSDPTNCVWVGRARTSEAFAVSVMGGRAYVADGTNGLTVLGSVPNVQFTVRVADATPNIPFTIEAATDLADSNSWTPLLTTNVATMPFDFVDFDVGLAAKPQKFYRVRQP